MAKKNPYLNDRDILDQALEHSWGKTADAKAKEKAYNREYYQRHKEEILRKARQAGEGIQRTAQNAYNAVRTETSALSRAASSPHARRRVNEGNPSLNAYERPRFSDEQLTNWANYETARRNMNAARNTPGEAAAQRELARRANRLSSTSTAINERAKDARQYGPEARFDSKLVRDAQNAYSKVRPGLRKAKNAAEDAINTAKNNAQAYIDNAMGKNGRRGSNIDTRQLEIDARKAQSKRNRINKSAQKASARSAARTEQAYQLNSDPKLRNGQFAKEALDNAVVSQRDAYEKAKMAKKARNEAMNSAAAYNQAQNAANRAGYDARYDSKLVRDFQNARAKARDFDKNPGKYVNKARDSVDQFVNNALSKTKKKKKS